MCANEQACKNVSEKVSSVNWWKRGPVHSITLWFHRDQTDQFQKQNFLGREVASILHYTASPNSESHSGKLLIGCCMCNVDDKTCHCLLWSDVFFISSMLCFSFKLIFSRIFVLSHVNLLFVLCLISRGGQYDTVCDDINFNAPTKHNLVLEYPGLQSWSS